MATIATATAPGVVLHGVTWDDYEAMLRIVGNRAVRVNYDRGEMEIWSPSWHHSKVSYLFGCIMNTLVEVLGVPFEPADPVTLRRWDLRKGVEPDKLFYFRDNAARVRGQRDLDLAIDPPPDLVIELDLTSSSVPRLPIFAALGIPEVWRLNGDDLYFLHLQPDGTYQPRDHSLAFPVFPLADAARFLEQAQDMDKMAWICTFRTFVRDHYVPRD